MIRPITIITAIMASGSGLFLYQSKHDVQVLDRQIERTVHDTAALREQSRLLAAEWTMLNDPERLRQFADMYLALKPIAPTQFTSMADLNTRLPAPRQTPPAPDDSAPDGAPDGAPGVETPVAAATLPPAPVSPASEGANDARPKQAERRINVAKPAPLDTPPPRAVVAAEPHPVSAAEPRVPRLAEARPAQEARPSQDARPAQEVRPFQEARPSQEGRPFQEARPAQDARLAQDSRPAPENRPAQELRPVRDVHLVQDIRPVQASRSAPVRPQSPAEPAPQSDAYNGSLLGMARGSVPAPVPRPTPVSATNWSSTN